MLSSLTNFVVHVLQLDFLCLKSIDWVSLLLHKYILESSMVYFNYKYCHFRTSVLFVWAIEYFLRGKNDFIVIKLLTCKCRKRLDIISYFLLFFISSFLFINLGIAFSFTLIPPNSISDLEICLLTKD